ncbi:MAG TPA: bifunctional DNA-formamidopyrimidine glycosylase/DNA-(apurinic or apyrimidinic site) lyase [Patescibacteria group bacterium]
MPELPEVETIRRGFKKYLTGKKIISVKVKVPKLVKLPVAQFKKLLRGSKIKDVRRRAKLLIIDLSNKFSLLIHLKMTGQLVYRRPGGQLLAGGHPIKDGLENLPNKYSHIVFTFNDQSNLFFNDLRKFGWMKVIATDQVEKYLREVGYGPEPLDQAFTLKKFKKMLAGREKSKIKALLLKQDFIAGLGNIYCDEACFYAKIHPLRTVKSLTDQEIKKLYQGIKKVLKDSIELGGTSFDQYVNIDGARGGYVPRLKVYQRQGNPCRRCCTKIVKIKAAGRGTHFCPKCQI